MGSLQIEMLRRLFPGKTDAEVNGYFSSPYCHDVEIIYDHLGPPGDILRERIRQEISNARKYPCRLCIHFRSFKQRCDLLNKSMSLNESNTSSCRNFAKKE